MALDYATKYQSKIAQRFTQKTLTAAGAGNEYKFTGARAVKIYTMNSTDLVDYGRGSTRFGSVTDVEFPTQEMVCTQSKAFSKHIEALDNADIPIEATAAKFLKMQQDEKITPMLDKWRFRKWLEGAATLKQVGNAPTKSTIGGLIMELKGAMRDKLVPDTGLTLFIAMSQYILLKQADLIINLADSGYSRKAVENGVVGTFDNMKVVPVPSSYLPTGVYWMIKAKGTTADPVKLAKYTIYDKVQGFSGPVIDGLTYFDAFVIGTKNAGIGVSGTSSVVLNAPTITISSHTMGIAAVTGAKLVYTLDGSDPRWSETAVSGTSGAAISGVTTTAGTVVRAIAVKNNCVGIEATSTDS